MKIQSITSHPHEDEKSVWLDLIEVLYSPQNNSRASHQKSFAVISQTTEGDGDLFKTLKKNLHQRSSGFQKVRDADRLHAERVLT